MGHVAFVVIAWKVSVSIKKDGIKPTKNKGKKQKTMEAKLIYREKYIYADGAIREMVIWQLPQKTWDRPHGLKYRLYYGRSDGTCAVRYDNESGKGDHRHLREKEEPYPFRNAESLIADFMGDIESIK